MEIKKRYSGYNQVVFISYEDQDAAIIGRVYHHRTDGPAFIEIDYRNKQVRCLYKLFHCRFYPWWWRNSNDLWIEKDLSYLKVIK